MTITHENARHINGKSNVQLGYYSNGRVVIQLIDPEDNCCNAIATVNVPQVHIPEGYVLVKNYSENEGLLEDLIAGGIVGLPIGAVPYGHAQAYVCKLLVAP